MKKEAGVVLDMKLTGYLLSVMIRKRGYTVGEIQKELGLSCPQPVYRWINGQTMPSIDNLYKLSTILGVHMDDLMIPRQDEVWLIQRQQKPAKSRRLQKYYKTYYQICHKKI